MVYDPNKFKTASPFIVSVDFSEFSDGAGFVTLYLMKSKSNAATIFSLQQNTMFSSEIETEVTNTSVTYTLDTSPFNIPRTVRGTAYVNIGYNRTAGGGTKNFEVQLFKWDGSSATPITSKFTTEAAAGNLVLNNTMPCTETLISAGDQLRLVVKVTASGAGENFYWGHDPVGRTGTNVSTTSSRIIIPFKFDG